MTDFKIEESSSLDRLPKHNGPNPNSLIDFMNFHNTNAFTSLQKGVALQRNQMRLHNNTY